LGGIFLKILEARRSRVDGIHTLLIWRRFTNLIDNDNIAMFIGALRCSFECCYFQRCIANYCSSYQSYCEPLFTTLYILRSSSKYQNSELDALYILYMGEKYWVSQEERRGEERRVWLAVSSIHPIRMEGSRVSECACVHCGY
jgi:hypothetical protein